MSNDMPDEIWSNGVGIGTPGAGYHTKYRKASTVYPPELVKHLIELVEGTLETENEFLTAYDITAQEVIAKLKEARGNE